MPRHKDMDIATCPVTGEKIIDIGRNGVTKRSNYAEAWFVLCDGSRMRVAMSRNAKKHLTEKQADAIMNGVRKEWEDSIRSKAIPKDEKERRLARIRGTGYSEVLAREGETIVEKAENIRI